MSICRACWRKTVGALSNAALAEANPRFLLPTTATSLPKFRRHIATVAADHDVDGPVLLPRTAAAEPSRAHSDSKALEWVVKKHLEHMKDPYRIAEHVLRTLEKGRFEEAALLTRKASRDAKVTVSWNHLIDYQMRNQRLHSAIKLYNEV